MQTKKKRIRIKTKVFVPLVFIIAVLFTTYFFPRQGSFKYNFNEGRPWQYGLLTAPFDFPVYKPAAQLKAEQDSILEFYEPYFLIDEEIRKNALAEFDADANLKARVAELAPEYKLYIRNKLNEVYDNGIMRSEDYDRIYKSHTQALRIKKGNVAESRKVEKFFTIRSAYEKVLNDTPSSIDAGILKTANINEYIRENVLYDAATSEKAQNEFIQQVDISHGLVQRGQRIIDQGEIVDSQTYNILSSLKRVTEERNGGTTRNNWVLLGQFLLILFMFASFYTYLLYFRPAEYRNRKHVLFMVLQIVFFILLTAITVRLELFSIYIIPYAIVTILIRTFIDSRTALFASLTTILVSSLMVPFPFEFIIIQISVAMVSIFMLKELTERSQLIKSSFFILLTYILVYIGLELYQEGNVKEIHWVVLVYFLINFIFIMFSYSLVYVVEKSFGFISGVSLVELSNINKPLLKELSEKAPGTFQHSLQVSNLAMAAAAKLGANASLMRTGALYHDIGKMTNPAFFTENQTPGMNPHAGLPPEESARIIINHVKDGVKIAQKHNLPRQIVEFIETHHGTSVPRYFYISWKNANPGKEANEADFRYPGPNPFSKETAIMMMADAVEASSRSLPEYTEESLRNLVDKIIDGQLAEGHFKSAPITFKDIQTAKDVFVEKLVTIYHSRIAYPELKRPEN
ncbi:HD family phosphohydrolase [Proteiniphilum sp. X52]|uniref:HD family phosphohydrolase n=1 Tax=Proteiniphilum sp. X52 TaxID=2382159 RepID=UPI000F09D86F|nr:HDIG domain-containing metalloprotein [Proteiniphilum sp. X52]RNC64328.1 HDIG domain-containing protein [Proteiniphilum sp. X52]